MTIPSPRGGTIVSRRGSVDDIVVVGDFIIVIDDATESDVVTSSVAEEPEVLLVATGQPFGRHRHQFDTLTAWLIGGLARDGMPGMSQAGHCSKGSAFSIARSL